MANKKTKKAKPRAKPQPKEKIIEEELIDEFGEDYDEEEFDENTIDNSLEIGGQIHLQSDIIKKNFNHLPKDVKYSKFGKIDVANFVLKSRTYHLWNYVNKCTYISKYELQSAKESRKKIYDIQTKQDFKDYLESIGKIYIWHSFLELTPEEFDDKFSKILIQLKEVREDGMINSLYGERERFYNAYDKYKSLKSESEYVDDYGLMNTMMTLTEVQKAKDGWGMGSMNTTINVTREENPKADSEEKPEDSENRSFINKFRK